MRFVQQFAKQNQIRPAHFFLVSKTDFGHQFCSAERLCFVGKKKTVDQISKSARLWWPGAGNVSLFQHGIWGKKKKRLDRNYKYKLIQKCTI